MVLNFFCWVYYEEKVLTVMGNNFTNNKQTNTSHLIAFLNKQLQCIDKVKKKYLQINDRETRTVPSICSDRKTEVDTG